MYECYVGESPYALVGERLAQPSGPWIDPRCLHFTPRGERWNLRVTQGPGAALREGPGGRTGRLFLFRNSPAAIYGFSRIVSSFCLGK